MGVLEKKVDITINGTQAKLNNPLNLYVNDKVRLVFTIKEFEYELLGGYSKSKSLKTITPISGKLSIETPVGVDLIENVDVINEAIYFELDSKYTGCAGTYQAQIFLTSIGGYQKAVPPFTFVVNRTINEELDGSTRKEVTLLLNDKGDCLLSGNNEILIFK